MYNSYKTKIVLKSRKTVIKVFINALIMNVINMCFRKNASSDFKYLSQVCAPNKLANNIRLVNKTMLQYNVLVYEARNE